LPRTHTLKCHSHQSVGQAVNNSNDVTAQLSSSAFIYDPPWLSFLSPYTFELRMSTNASFDASNNAVRFISQDSRRSNFLCTPLVPPGFGPCPIRKGETGISQEMMSFAEQDSESSFVPELREATYSIEVDGFPARPLSSSSSPSLLMLWEAVTYFQLRTVDPTSGQVSSWSETSLPWTVARDCRAGQVSRSSLLSFCKGHSEILVVVDHLYFSLGKCI
jgi:hypothetical protein